MYVYEYSAEDNSETCSDTCSSNMLVFQFNENNGNVESAICLDDFSPMLSEVKGCFPDENITEASSFELENTNMLLNYQKIGSSPFSVAYKT